MKNVRTIVLAGVLSAALFTGSAFSYLADADRADNRFTVGHVAIDLLEPGFENGMPEARNLVPGGVVTKDPYVVNTGTNDAFVFLKVTIPTEMVMTAAENGMPANAGEALETQLFGYEKNENWTLLTQLDPPAGEVLVFNRTEEYGLHESAAEGESGRITYIYAYTQGDPSKMKVLGAGEQTEPLFEKVKMAEIIEDQNLEASIRPIDLEAYAIQSDFVNAEDSSVDGSNTEGVYEPLSVWKVLENSGTLH